MKKQLLTLLICLAGAVQMPAQEFLHIGDNLIPVANITKITASHQEHPQSLSILLKNDENIQLFTAALEATGWMEKLKCYADEDYSVGNDSTNWNNDKLVFLSAEEYDNVAYMRERLIAHTVFIEPDTVFNNKYGISSLDDLRLKAHALYDPMYPEDVAVGDETDPRNALNRFVAYHILPFRAGYYQLTCVDGENSELAALWNRRKQDIADWYEACMPHSIMKCSFPSGSQSGLYINRRGVQSRADEREVFVRGAKVYTPAQMAETPSIGVNGTYHYIDDIIAYDQQTQQVVLDERMRIDCSTLSPDFITSGARGHKTRNGRYGVFDWSLTSNNRNTCLGFKAGSARNFEYNDEETHLHVRPRALSFWSYQGDEVCISGQFDVTVKLPPLPAGTYELRLGTCVGYTTRTTVQFYLDGAAQGDPVDFRPKGKDLCGWKSDTELGDEEAIAAFDQSLREQGWMKGPASYPTTYYNEWFRDLPNTLRKIIGTFTTDGKTDHYLRMTNTNTEDTAPKWGWEYKHTLDFDYLELVPSTIYDNAEVPEDRL